MPLASRLIFAIIKWRARGGLTRETETFADGKSESRQRGVRGETFAYWYLRKQGYVFVARNYVPRGARGEIDLVGYDGETLAFVEVRTRTASEERAALPELSVTADKQEVVARTARRFVMERHVKQCPMRFDVVAIEEVPGRSPVVRLHKAAFYPQI